ncbi:MAG TPA: FtsX-like permease family protein [Anaerolineales bacterium]|nr:FtsX-like permease family protein [Anaerolineales bacterium]
MGNLRRTKIFRDLRRDRARTLLLVLAITVGVAAYGLMISGSIVLEENIADVYMATNPAHAVITVSHLDEEALEGVRKLSGVADIVLRRLIRTWMEVAPGDRTRLFIYVYPELENLSLQKITLEHDAAFPHSPDELLLERSIADIADIEIGEEIRVLDAGGDEVTLRVSGFVNDLSQLPTNMSLVAGGYATLAVAEVLGEPQEYNQLLIRLKPSIDTQGEINRAVEEVTGFLETRGSRIFFISIPQPGQPILGENMSSILVILRAMGVLTLLLSGFLVINVMSAHILRQVPQIGILKSIGGRTSQISSMYFQQVFLVGLIAFLFAVPLGLAGSYLLVDGVADGLNFNVKRFFLPVESLWLQVLSAVLIPLISASVPIFLGSRTTIREALIGRVGSVDVRPGILTRLLDMNRTLPQVFRMSFLNIFRRRGRLVLTLMALSLAGAMFIAILGLRISLDDTVREGEQTQNYDVALDFAAPYDLEAARTLALSVEGVEQVEGWGLAAGRFEVAGVPSGSFTLVGIPADTRMVLPVFAAGGWIDSAEPDGVALTLEAWDLTMRAEIGESIRAEIAGEAHVFRIRGVGWRAFQSLAFMPYSSFEELTGQDGLVNRLVVVTSAHDPAAQQAAMDDLVDVFESAGYALSDYVTTTQSRGSVTEQVNLLYVVLMSMVMLIAVVGGLGLGITVSLNVIERTREIGILRSIGAADGVVRGLVLRESLLVAIASWGIGALASVPLGLWLGKVLGMILSQRPLNYFFSVWGLLLWFGLVILIAYAASLAPARKATRVTIREALAYEG